MSKSNNKLLIENIYTNIVKTSRNKSFFLDYKVDDTVEGRFDIILLHSFIIFNYFISTGKSKSKIPQLLFDHMFSDFDSNLREMGFGDIAVNKRMKKFISAFYGRILSYSNSYAEYKENNSILSLSYAIKKNIYKNKKTTDEKINIISDYVVSNITSFLDNSYEKNINIQFKFKKLVGA